MLHFLGLSVFRWLIMRLFCCFFCNIWTTLNTIFFCARKYGFVKSEHILQLMSREKYFQEKRCRLIKSKVEHEDNLISNRLNWMFALQVGLLVAYFGNSDCNSEQHGLIAIIGILTSLSIGYNLILGECSLRKLRDLFDKEYVQKGKCSSKDKLLIVGHVGQRNSFSIRNFLLPTYLIPFVFILCWLYLLVCDTILWTCICSALN